MKKPETVDCRQPEAFALMQYQDPGNPQGPIEWIWNSRDGVTPFIVRERDGNTMLQHIHFGDDIFAPQYVPNIGQRVFIDLTEEKARQYNDKRCETMWERGPTYEHDDMNPRTRYQSLEEMKEALLPSMLEGVEKREPDIVVCTPALQLAFLEQREERRRGLTAYAEELEVMKKELQS